MNMLVIMGSNKAKIKLKGGRRRHVTVHWYCCQASGGEVAGWVREGHLWVSALSALSCFPKTLCPPGVDKKLPCLCAPPPSSTSCTWMVTCVINVGSDYSSKHHATNSKLIIYRAYGNIVWTKCQHRLFVLAETKINLIGSLQSPAVVEVHPVPVGQQGGQMLLVDWLA